MQQRLRAFCAKYRITEGRKGNKSWDKMSKKNEKRLSQAVRKYPALYDKTSVDFRDKRKKSLM